MATPAFAQLDILSGKPLKRSADSPNSGLVRPEDVITVSAEFTPGSNGEPGSLSVTADIAPPWYTYAITQKPVQATPTLIQVDPSNNYQIVGDWRPNLPPITKHLGDETFETHARERHLAGAVGDQAGSRSGRAQSHRPGANPGLPR